MPLSYAAAAMVLSVAETLTIHAQAACDAAAPAHQAGAAAADDDTAREDAYYYAITVIMEVLGGG